MKSALFTVSFCAISGVAILGCSAAAPANNGMPGDADGGLKDAKNNATADAAVNALAPDVQLVNAATGLGDVRICFEPGADPAQPSDAIVPQTNYPGLPVGGSVFFRNSSAVRGKNVTPFALSASGLGSAEYGRAMFTCAELSSNPLINKIAIEPLVVSANAPAILALVGCPAGVGDVARCGSTFDIVKGNLHFKEVYVGGTLVQNGIGTFVVNLSSSLQADVNNGTASSHLGSLANPCSGQVVDQSSLKVGAIGPAAQTATRPTAFDTEGFAVCIKKNQLDVPLLARSYAQVQRATEPASLPADHFGKTADFVFTIVGDTTVQSGPEAAHVLAIAFEASN